MNYKLLNATLKFGPFIGQKIPSEMEVAPRYKLLLLLALLTLLTMLTWFTLLTCLTLLTWFTLFILFKLLDTAKTFAFTYACHC